MISDKAKNVYLTRLRREDVKTISDEFALIPRRRRRHRVERYILRCLLGADEMKVWGDILIISDGAINFVVRAGEKSHKGVIQKRMSTLT